MTSSLQDLLLSSDMNNISISNKENWLGRDLIKYQNLYLAEDFNKLNKINVSINLLSSLNTPDFISFVKDIDGYIIGIMDSTGNRYVPSINRKSR